MSLITHPNNIIRLIGFTIVEQQSVLAGIWAMPTGSERCFFVGQAITNLPIDAHISFAGTKYTCQVSIKNDEIICIITIGKKTQETIFY